jgi:glycosyltransferase involved in cell wall biosynthesis
MTNLNSHPAEHRPRLLITAYHYDRAYSMESRLSWQRAQHAAADFGVTVICARGETSTPADASETGAERNVQVEVLPLNRLERALMRRSGTYYAGYRLWHRRVFRLARQLHEQRPFALAHHVSFCGYREPSDCLLLGVPFVWGPVGGTSPLPPRFLGQLDLPGAVREISRNMLNWFQLRLDARVRRAMTGASQVLAANREVARDLQHVYGIAPTVRLETGISQTRTSPRPPRDASQPLKILWSGRLRSWKGLPLLLRALAELPPDCRYTLRVLGQGACLQRWQRLAERLSIAERVEWVGWPEYSRQIEHYDWADVFAFTSLRDTSGTGLLEALAAGSPIIGIDHQGAADVMTDRCAIRVPAQSPALAIAGFRDAVQRLAGDEALLASLSDGALDRSREFLWDRNGEVMQEVYRDALQSRVEKGTTPAPPSSPAASLLVRQESLSGVEIVPAKARSPHEALC